MSRRRFLGLMCIGVVMLSCFTLWGQAPEKTQIAFRTRRNETLGDFSHGY